MMARRTEPVEILVSFGDERGVEDPRRRRRSNRTGPTACPVRKPTWLPANALRDDEKENCRPERGNPAARRQRDAQHKQQAVTGR